MLCYLRRASSFLGETPMRKMHMRNRICMLASAVALAALGTAAGAQSYTISSIGPVGSTYSRPWAVNKAGQVAGVSYVTNTWGSAFIFDAASKGAVVQLLPSLPGTLSSEALAINDAGQV